MGTDRLNKFCNFCQNYINNLQIPVKTSNHVERRNGMVNVSPVGRACSRDERNEFEEYDKVHNIRKDFIEVLRKEFGDYGLRYSIGG